ncbi:MAG: hypothetical protein OEZ39_00770 [Gammaproteobacteria bacterium]|nr:hypothetical protein [Gammaproteobacteria bacterium]MDH5650382.1 hypothetical protein [Gammaproteobacteria bacterium]
MTDSENNTKQSVFRAFNVADFVSYQSWYRLESILNSNGGAYGIGGPRGSGKTWLISRCVEMAREKGGVGLWFPTPSDYGAEPFLTTLADNFAHEVQLKFSSGAPRWYSRFSSVWLFSICIANLFFMYMNGNYPSELLRNYSNMFFHTKPYLLSDVVLQLTMAIVWFGSVYLAMASFFAMYSKRHISVLLYSQANDLRQRLRYSETQSRGLESTAKLGFKSSFDFKVSQKQDLAERALTIASLVYEFRNFIRLVSQSVSGPVVIGIDELDKLHDAETAKKLLRDIKGIFEVDGVHFFISVSDEARKTLNLGSILERDEFHSSFYTVIDTLPILPEQCADLLEQRSPGLIEHNAQTSIGILSGGNLREAVRLADICLKSKPVELGKIALFNALISIINEESKVIISEVIRSDLSESCKLDIYRILGEDMFENKNLLAQENIFSLLEEWSRDNEEQLQLKDSEAYRSLFELLSRFRVRLKIVQQLYQSPDLINKQQSALRLQNVVIMLRDSAAIAEEILKNDQDQCVMLDNPPGD